jgi:beta-lactamase class D
VFARPGDAEPEISDKRECAHPTAPASTFKIPHALLALELAVIRPETVFPWDGTPREFESWRRSHTLDSAVKASVLPFFQHTARLIGAARMRQGLERVGYASDGFDGDHTTFWLNGDLVISPIEQVAFLRRMLGGTLPIAPGHVAIVRDAIRMPSGRILNASGAHAFALAWPRGTVVRAKTGSTVIAGERVRWLVGALEDRGAHHVFAARVRGAGDLPNTAALDLAIRELNARAPR